MNEGGKRKSMRDFNDRVVVITGAASGIGRETALAFARRGARLSVCDLNGDGLRALGEELESMGTGYHSEIVDVSQAWQVEEFCENTYRKMGRADVLCNNAGVAVGGFVKDMSLDDWKWILGVNLWGVIHGCHFFYPRMIEQGGGGHIVNVSSGAALSPLPGTTAYNSTKFAVCGYSQSLRAEAAVYGIGVSVICPGIVATGITGTARMRAEPGRREAQEYMERIDRFFQRFGYEPSRVADAIIRGVERDRAVVVDGWETHLGDFAYRLSRSLYLFVLKLVTRLSIKWM